MEVTRVEIREFRADLTKYIGASSPVAVTRHGQTVGYFIPIHSQAETDMVALKKASQSLDKLLSAQGVDAEDVITDFKKALTKSTPAASVKLQYLASSRSETR